jgi:hypothetical protein
MGRKLGARGALAFRFFRDPEMDWLLKRVLIAASEHGAEIGECLYVADRVKPRDPDSWVDEWEALGDRLVAQAEGSLGSRHRVSAREAYLRATSYCRSAEYLAVCGTPRAHEILQKSRRAFHCARDLFSPAVRRIEVDFEGCTLPGCLWRPANRRRAALPSSQCGR